MYKKLPLPVYSNLMLICSISNVVVVLLVLVVRLVRSLLNLIQLVSQPRLRAPLHAPPDLRKSVALRVVLLRLLLGQRR